MSDRDETARDLDQRLDDALSETYPASDPICLTLRRPVLEAAAFRAVGSEPVARN